MVNQRLRGAMINAELTPAALANLVEVDIKSVHRWIAEDRVPYPVTRVKVAHALDQQETFLWPQILGSADGGASTPHEIDQVWATRSAVSTESWHALFSAATDRIDILIYAGAFLMDSMDIADVVKWKASHGVQVRMLVGDPDGLGVRQRAAELSLDWLPERCRSTARYLRAMPANPQICVRGHDTTLYASLFRFDDLLLVNVHAYGVWASLSPVYRVHRTAPMGLHNFYAASFERVWEASGS